MPTALAGFTPAQETLELLEVLGIELPSEKVLVGFPRTLQKSD